MTEEFKEDIGKTVQFFLKNGRTYTGKINNVNQSGNITINDKFNKPVKIREDAWSSVEYNK